MQGIDSSWIYQIGGIKRMSNTLIIRKRIDRRKNAKSVLCSTLLFALLLCGCGKASAPQASAASDPEATERSTVYVDSMDTFIELSAFGSQRDAALQAAKEEILRLNDLLSIGVESSEISRINREGSGTVSADTAAMIREALTLFEETDGAFDLTVYPLMELWGFVSKEYHVPTDEELAETMLRIGADRVQLDDETSLVTLDEGQSIDRGGMAKCFASQRLMDIFRENGVESAIVSLGGNMQCLGTKPDGSPWRIGVKDPFNPDFGLSAIVQIVDKAVITSGGYERYFVDEETGTTYRHIIDPATGYPAESGLSSVSIVTADGMLGDGLSTALYIMGLEKSAEFWRAHKTEFDAILIDNDGNVYVTAGLEGAVTSEHTITFLR